MMAASKPLVWTLPFTLVSSAGDGGTQAAAKTRMTPFLSPALLTLSLTREASAYVEMGLGELPPHPKITGASLGPSEPWGPLSGQSGSLWHVILSSPNAVD